MNWLLKGFIIPIVGLVLVLCQNGSGDPLNINLPPGLALPDTLLGYVQDSVIFTVSATDPNNEPVSISAYRLPFGATFSGVNPGTFMWLPGALDTGQHYIPFRAVDPHGAADVESVLIQVSSAPPFVLEIFSVSGYNDETVVVPILLSNSRAIGGFDLRIHYDPSALSLLSVQKSGTRAYNWELYTYVDNANNIPGDLRLVGIADINNAIITPPLDTGRGPIAFLTFRITGDPNFAGLSIPLTFIFRSLVDNVLSTPAGDLISSSQIGYLNGEVHILRLEILIGDINLNGTPFDIGDAVRLINYFLYPSLYRLSAQARANSDINGDGIPATVGDLVALIQEILRRGPGTILAPPDRLNVLSQIEELKSSPAGRTVKLVTTQSHDGIIISCESSEPLGALLIEIDHSGMVMPAYQSLVTAQGLQIQSYDDGNAVRFIIFSPQAIRIPVGSTNLIQLISPQPELLNPTGVTVSDTLGELLPAIFEKFGEPTVIPQASLQQNYPNPFNPVTTIHFSLAISEMVTLKVFNISGQLVKILQEGVLKAGSHQVIWDSTNQEGEQVSSGVYLYRLETTTFSQTRKMLLIR